MPLFQIINPPPFNIQEVGNEMFFSIMALAIVAACVLIAISLIDKDDKEKALAMKNKAMPKFKKAGKRKPRAKGNVKMPKPVTRSRYQASSRRP